VSRTGRGQACGASRPFEEAMPREMLERKVRALPQADGRARSVLEDTCDLRHAAPGTRADGREDADAGKTSTALRGSRGRPASYLGTGGRYNAETNASPLSCP